jgi:hypothetical protein
LLETVKSELALIVDVDFERRLAKLFADGANFLRERGAEHHHLLIVGRLAKDLLNIAAHIELREHLIALIEHKMLDLVEHHPPSANDEIDHAARGADNDVGAVVLQKLTVLRNGDASVKYGTLDVLEVLGKPLVLVVNLKCELTGVAQDDDADLPSDGLQLVKRREDKHSGFSHT